MLIFTLMDVIMIVNKNKLLPVGCILQELTKEQSLLVVLKQIKNYKSLRVSIAFRLWGSHYNFHSVVVG